MPGGLVALALGGFGIGLTEFLIAGLLPQIASGLAVSDATAGRLISGYAPSVAVGAIALTAATARLPRKNVLVGLVALFVLGNLPSAVAPDCFSGGSSRCATARSSVSARWSRAVRSRRRGSPARWRSCSPG